MGYIASGDMESAMDSKWVKLDDWYEECGQKDDP